MGFLDGTVAVITGAGSGIGKASAKAFVREGARVVAADISGAENDTAAELGDAAVPVHCDVSRAEDVAAMIDTAVERFGKVDAVLNVAGVAIFAPLHETTREQFDTAIDVLLRGVYLGTQYGIQAMLDNGNGGVIINVSSVGGLNAAPGTSAYSAAKAAVIAVTKATAVEYGAHGIRANAICPGFILSEGMGLPFAREFPEAARELAGKAPLGRAGEPHEVAEVAAFLASDRASFVSGAIVPVDGGQSIKLA